MSFVNTFFLGALGAMLLPVLFHFVRKMRAKTVPFSSLMFLSATPQERVKRRRLRDVFLMALRMTVLGLVVLAFARPFVPPEQLPFLSTEEDESVVYLLDASYSMDAAGAFESGRREILRRIDNASDGDELAVVTFSEYAEQLSGFESDRSLHRDVVTGAATVTGRGTDFYEPLRFASELLRSARHDKKRVVLVSDMQRAGWTGSLDNWNLEPGVDFEPVLAASADGVNRYFGDVSVRVHRVGDEAVVQFDGRTEIAESAGGEPAEGAEARDPFVVTLDVNDRNVDEVTIDPAGVKRFSFRRVADRNGFEQGELSLADDVLATDNKYYFTYLVDDRPSVLVIDGASRVNSGLVRNDGYFLEKAFSPRVSTRNIAPFSIDVRGRDRLRAVPANTDVVFVANLPSLNQQEVGAIQRYVEQGGNVVISFGEQTDVAAYSRSLQNLGIGSATAVVSSGDAIVGQVDRRHPIFAPFVGPGGGTILKPQFRRFVNVAPAADVQVLATYDTGEPFLLEKPRGTGSILVYTSTFGNAWTDFPINEMFVPFVYQLARHASADDQRDLMFSIGDVVHLDGPPQSTWEVRTPTGAVYRVTTDSVGVGLYARTEWPGQYLAARGAVRVPFSVNLDRSESELIARDVEEAYAGVVSPSVEQPEFIENASLSVEAEEKKQKLWRWVLLAALLVFAVETVLSNRPRRS